jgi:hypothetical protein
MLMKQIGHQQPLVDAELLHDAMDDSIGARRVRLQLMGNGAVKDKELTESISPAARQSQAISFRIGKLLKQFAALAGDLLSRDDRDHLSRELSQLKTRILRATGIDEMLRSWSEGIVSNKIFQQLTEELRK